MRQCELIVGLGDEQCPKSAVAQTWNPKRGDRSGGVAAFCQEHLDELREDGDVVWPVDEELVVGGG